jgi:hypothetical protein
MLRLSHDDAMSNHHNTSNDRRPMHDYVCAYEGTNPYFTWAMYNFSATSCKGAQAVLHG